MRGGGGGGEEEEEDGDDGGDEVLILVMVIKFDVADVDADDDGELAAIAATSPAAG